MMPFANPRHQHEIKVFGNFPLARDQSLIVGCIDTTTAFVEHPEVVADRLVRAAEAVGDPARIQAGTDCGRSEEQTSELQSLMRISYAVFCLQKKKTKIKS